jgi:hypothetical protein
VAAPAEFHATPASPAAGRIDLLTVVSHELGHILGLPDLVNDHSGALMDEILEPGVRRLPARQGLPTSQPPLSASTDDVQDAMGTLVSAAQASPAVMQVLAALLGTSLQPASSGLASLLLADNLFAPRSPIDLPASDAAGAAARQSPEFLRKWTTQLPTKSQPSSRLHNPNDSAPLADPADLVSAVQARDCLWRVAGFEI